MQQKKAKYGEINADFLTNRYFIINIDEINYRYTLVTFHELLFFGNNNAIINAVISPKGVRITDKRAGFYKSNLSGESAYQSFVPAPLPPKPPVELDSEMVELLIKANNQVTLLTGLASRIPNVDLFVTMYVRKEALLSSQIEGTQTTLEDVLNPLIDENANRDVADVVNYIKATDYALSRRKELPLCNRLLKETHAVLMQGVRGQEKSPGEFRTSQNWIGGAGSTIKNARYIPPAPDDMIEAISDLEKYLNTDDDLDLLIRAGLIHYQFETIHPFLDGNGRIGRLLITLFLMEKGVLKTPALYISYFLKKNRIEYYDRMSEVRRSGSYEQWIKFFLRAIYESAQDAVETIDELTALHSRSVALIGEPSRSTQTILAVFRYLETNPIIEIKKTAEALELSYNAVSRAVELLVEKGLLNQPDKQGRTRIFSYGAYLEILRKDT
ncbi:MAG: Fic family protein [Lentisphaerae bacterium]|nr:Fic family protein [Lentisphaerota bacterium]